MAFATIDVTKGITGTIPVANGGTGLTSGTSGQFLKFTGTTTVGSAAVDSGLTEVDMWRLEADFTQTAEPITNNFERVDSNSFSKIGTGLTFSSGVWTFGVLGLYKITFQSQHRRNGENPSLEQVIQVSSNAGGAWGTAVKGYPALQEYGSSTVYSSGSCHCILNVSGTASNFQVRLMISNASDAYTNGSSTQNRTYIMFERLGDAQ
jgi:hypothetical protein